MSVTPIEPKIQEESKTSTKTVYFIRHGESEYNAYKSRKSTWFTCRCWCCCDPNFQDPRLSAHGRDQVLALRAEVARLKLGSSVQLIYVSPLSRAIETCCGSFPAPPERPHIIVSELIAEVMDTMGDIGRSPEELSREFTDLSFEGLNSSWWFHDPKKGPLVPIKEPLASLQSRQKKFLAELAARPEQTICVVGHSAFIKHITKSSSKLSNCAIMKTVLDVNTQTITQKEVIYSGRVKKS